MESGAVIVRVAQTFLETDRLDVDLARSHAIVVDVLRATTSMIVALDHGAREIIPAGSIEEAIRFRSESDSCTLLAGERQGMKIEGFDLGNSPGEFSPLHVHGKTIVMATTNGTRALQHCADAYSVTIGALRNAQALAGYQLKRISKDGPPPDPVVIVCAGTDERYSQDDLIAAGSILDAMITLNGSIDVDDAGLTAIDLYRHHASDLEAALARTTHGKKLTALGFGDDIRVAAENSVSNALPVMKNGKIVALRNQPDGPEGVKKRPTGT